MNKINRDLVVTLMLSGIYVITQNSEFLPLSTYSENIVFEFVLGIIAYLIIVKKNLIRASFLFFIVSMNLLVPDLAIVPRLSISSSFDMPIPLS